MKGFFLKRLFLLAGACGLVLAGAAHAGISEKYPSVKVARGVKAGSGAVAWSPQGKKIASIGRNVEIYDVESREKSKVKVSDPSFLLWASEGELVVLHGSEGRSLTFVNAESLEQKTTALPVFVNALSLAHDGRRLFLTATKAEQVSIGVSVEYALHDLELGDGGIGELLKRKRILYKYKMKNEEDLGGWLGGGPNPLGEEFILVEHVKPPNALPYLQVYVVDVFTGRVHEVARVRPGALRPPGSWSPLGRRAAIVDEDRNLLILELDGGIRSVAAGIRGTYPAWNPVGDALFFGGYLVKISGEQVEEIVRGEPESAAFWSPDGRSMALLVDGRLRVLSGFEPHRTGVLSREEVRRKIHILRELKVEGFLSEREYEERYQRLTGREGKER